MVDIPVAPLTGIELWYIGPDVSGAAAVKKANVEDAIGLPLMSVMPGVR